MVFPPSSSALPFLLLLPQLCLANEHAKRLFDDLLQDYDRLRRPPALRPSSPSILRLKLRLSQIIDVHEIDQIMTVSVWLRQSWTDPRMCWEPAEYGGITTLYVPHEMLWVPDLVLYNNADSHYNVTIGTKATLTHTGKVLWEPPAVFKSLCQIDVQWFPFDEQLCQLKFGSWSYSEDLLRLTFWEDAEGAETETENGIDLSDYYPSVEWDVMSVRAVRHSRPYPGRSAGQTNGKFGDIVYNLALRRKPLFYTVNLVFPCVGISFLTILVFYLPSDSGEKIALCISILVALTVFFLLLAEIMPATSTVLPLIGKYLLFTMCMVTLSVMITVLSLNFHFRKPTTHVFAPWIRRLFLRWLPKLLFMRRPLDVSARLLDGQPKVPRRKNLTVARLQQQLDHSLGPIRVLRHSPLDAMCRPPLDERLRQLYRCPKAEKAFENVCFVAELLRRKDRDQKVDQDWKYVASVLDRLFLVLFALCCFLGTAWILLQAPIFYDRRRPIDLQFGPSEQSGEL